MIMKKKTYEGYTYVDGGVCAAKGFVANGINCGLNSDKELRMIWVWFTAVQSVMQQPYIHRTR